MKFSRENFFTPVGRVVVLFNEIETTLIILTGSLCILEHGAVFALMAEASFSRKLDALKCIGDEKIRDDKLRKELDDVLKQLQDAETIRNQVVHTLWLGTADGQARKMKWSGKRKTGNSPNLRGTSLEEIESAGNQIQSASLKLTDFIRTLQNFGILKIKFVQD